MNRLIAKKAAAVLLLFRLVFPSAMAAELSVRELSLPTVALNQQHHLAQMQDGRLIVSWVETFGLRNDIRFATYAHGRWSPAQTVVSIDDKLAAAPVVLGLSDGTLATAWMAAVHDSENPFAADIYLARSSDGGRTWSAPLKPYLDPARIYDAQMSLAPLPDAGLALVWTDGRHVGQAPENHSDSRFQLMATVLDKHWRPGPEFLLDDDVCSCCSSYTDARGNELITVYRDHLEGDIRDIGAVRWNRGGNSRWQPVHDDHWILNGCPSNGPSIDLADKGGVAAWFTAADGNGRVKVSFMQDPAAGFQAPIDIDDQAIGHASVLLLDDGSAMISWRHNAGPEEELWLARVMPDGRIMDRTLVYRGGFPRWPSRHVDMARIGNDVFVAWMDPVQKKVRLAAVALE